jgi:cytochrome b subunit of formate dehydrogenase
MGKEERERKRAREKVVLDYIAGVYLVCAILLHIYIIIIYIICNIYIYILLHIYINNIYIT